LDCKMAGRVCVTVAHGTPCLGPVTHTGCGALCPRYDRGCYGCFGPVSGANTASLASVMSAQGATSPELMRAFRTFNANAPEFRAESEKHDG
jgi:sulfhydrogenase subunit delta